MGIEHPFFGINRDLFAQVIAQRICRFGLSTVSMGYRCQRKYPKISAENIKSNGIFLCK